MSDRKVFRIENDGTVTTVYRDEDLAQGDFTIEEVKRASNVEYVNGGWKVKFELPGIIERGIEEKFTIRREAIKAEIEALNNFIKEGLVK